MLNADDRKYLDEKFGRVHERLDDVVQRVGAVDSRTSRLEGKLENGIVTKAACAASMKAVDDRCVDAKDRLKGINARVWGLLALLLSTAIGLAAYLIRG